MKRRSYSIAVFTHSNQVEETIKLIKSLQLPSRVRIVLYIPQKDSEKIGDYPVNKLRNIAIVNIITTHFLVMDMDMRPARMFTHVGFDLANLYEELHALPSSLRMTQKAAVIVPAFFLEKRIVLSRCKDIRSCAERCGSLLLAM